jgi:hypothetical protein
MRKITVSYDYIGQSASVYADVRFPGAADLAIAEPGQEKALFRDCQKDGAHRSNSGELFFETIVFDCGIYLSGMYFCQGSRHNTSTEYAY